MPSHALDPARLDRAFALVAGQVDDGTVPFVILGVANAAGTIRLEGVSAPERPRIGTEAVCLLASVTKPIVATAVMELVEAGRFSLTTPLETWVPELVRPGRLPFTAWHVLSHTTGLDDIDLERLIVGGGGRDELLRQTLGQPQEAVPGSRYRYASFPFDVLALAVERATGRLLAETLRDGVLGPLGMTATTFDPRVEHADRMAPIRIGGWDGIRRHEGRDLVDGFVDLGLAGGGLWSTAHDVLRFGRAMLRGGELDGARVLARPFVELMTREVTVGGLGADPDRLLDEHYALGWGTRGPAGPASSRAFGHGGVSGTRLWIDPGHDLVIVYLTGDWGLGPQPIDAVLNAVYGAVV